MVNAEKVTRLEPLMHTGQRLNSRWRAVTLLYAFYFLPAMLGAGEPVELARGTGADFPQQPQVAVDAQGTIHVVYGAGERIRYRRSEDRGRTFSQSIELPTAGIISLGMRRGPRIAATKTGICVTVIVGKQGKGRDGDLLAMRSVDGGQTWSPPTQVNTIVDAAREGLHSMAAGPSGELCCVWLDLRNRKTEIMASISTDGGATWSENVLVYHSPDGSVCECCHPSVVIDERGRIHVQWRNSLGGARDIYIASSQDQGKTFGTATKLGNGSWPLAACPMDGGSVAVNAGGNLVSAWRRDKNVFTSWEGEPKEQLLGVGEQPWIAATSRGAFVIWLKKRGDALYLLPPDSKTPWTLANHAADPVIAAGPQGRGPVVAAWESRDGAARSIHCQVIAEELRQSESAPQGSR